MNIFRLLFKKDKSDIRRMREKKDIKGLIEVLAAPKNTFAPEIKWEAAGALGAIGDKRAVEPLITVLSDHSYFTDPDGWHYYVYLKAADALGEIGDNRAVEPLIAMLSEVDLTGCCYFDVDDFSTQQLSTAARALGMLRDPRAVEPLLAVLRNVKDHGIGIGAGNKVAFEYVVKALGEIADPRAIDPLTDFVNVGWTEEAKKALIQINEPPK